jgi:protein-tyrosine phosphatase
MVATPHVSARCPNDADTIAGLVIGLNERLQAEQVPVQILPGAEIALTHLPNIDENELRRLGLGGSRFLLLEPPFALVAPGLENAIAKLRAGGFEIVLAHPERCPALQRDRRIVPELAAAGVLMSLTAGSLVGRFGGEVKRYALELARERLIHNVTSDAHDSLRRPPGMAAELQSAGLAPMADWLTTLVPQAILSGSEIPPRPQVAVGRRRGWRRRG